MEPAVTSTPPESETPAAIDIGVLFCTDREVTVEFEFTSRFKRI